MRPTGCAPATGFLGSTLLDYAQRSVEDDDRHDGPGFKPVSQQRRYNRRDHQQNHDEVIQLVPEHLPERGWGGFFQLIWAVCGQPRGRLLGREACIGRRCQLL